MRAKTTKREKVVPTGQVAGPREAFTFRPLRIDAATRAAHLKAQIQPELISVASNVSEDDKK